MARNSVKYWERISPVYAGYLKKNKKCYNELCKEIKENLEPGMLVLELSCGSGMITKKLADSVLEWTATDPSPKNLQNARKLYRKNKGRGTNFRIESFGSIKYESSTFDAVVLPNALQVMEAPDKALKEICRVLRPGGMIIAPTFVFDRDYSIAQTIKMNVTGFKMKNKWTSDELAEFVEKYGFIVETQHLIEGKPVDECLIVAKKKTARDSVKEGGKTVIGSLINLASKK